MKFSQYRFDQQIHRNIEAMGFKRPTDIQFKSITPILKGDDLLAIAQTGTGKTIAFALPIVNIIHENKSSKRSNGVQCLVMVPTRELALQITEVFESLCKYTRAKVMCLMGGVEQERQIESLLKGVDIVVATPGRMFDLNHQGYLQLNDVEILVLDEADHMLDLGFVKSIRDLVYKLPKNRQTLFFSATITPYIKKIAYSLTDNPIRIQISPENTVSKNIVHYVTHIAMDDKRFFLERLVKENPDSKILVFVRTKVRAERVQKAMERLEIIGKTLHGDVLQKERLSILDEFKKGNFKLLITTDVSARGIDIPNVEYVVNYDIPEEPENYVHRVGRTGRGTKKGYAVSFCSDEEKPLIAAIEEYIGQPVEIMKIEKGDYSETLDFSGETKADWKTLLKEIQEFENFKESKGKNKNKR